MFQPSSPWAAAGFASVDYNSISEARQTDFQFELLPLHSQLLGESLLVSFPPLINMLKFSGFSYLISGPIVEIVEYGLVRRGEGKFPHPSTLDTPHRQKHRAYYPLSSPMIWYTPGTHPAPSQPNCLGRVALRSVVPEPGYGRPCITMPPPASVPFPTT